MWEMTETYRTGLLNGMLLIAGIEGVIRALKASAWLTVAICVVGIIAICVLAISKDRKCKRTDKLRSESQ